MDGTRFDHLTQAFSLTWVRRGVLQGLAAALGVVTMRPLVGQARKRKQKLKRNALGCVNVGGRCRGNHSVCCSGVCQGPKPKKGAKDTSRCLAHDASTCQVGQNACGGPQVSCITSTGQTSGVCYTTTGNAPYCGALDAGNCVRCTKDAECIPICGERAACVRCTGAGCASSGGFACVVTDSCVPPARQR
jgi:hypothetical protein